MLKSCTKKYTDESDERTFRFTFYCDVCGKPFTARPIAFTEADALGEGAAPINKQLSEVLWQKEHDAAFGRADSEVNEKLFRCPCCFEVVCGDCVRGVQTPEGIASPRCKNCQEKSANKTFGFSEARR